MVRQPVSQTGNLSSILSDTTYYRVCSIVVNVPDCQSGDWGSIPTSKSMESIEEKLDKILKNQEILNRNQIMIYRELISQRKSKGQDFLTNYLADLAGTATSVLLLEDILKNIKKPL